MEKTETNRLKSRKAMKSRLKMTREPKEIKAKAEEPDVDLQGRVQFQKHANALNEGDADSTTGVDPIEAHKDSHGSALALAKTP